MRNKSVAVVDVRSSDITAVVAERGVNNTFVIKSKFSCEYDGYAEGQFLDELSFCDALRSVVKSTIAAAGGHAVKTLYIGVPGEFTDVVVSDNTISFYKTKKVSAADVAALEEVSAPKKRKNWRLVRSGCMYYVLSDMRKVTDPVGLLSDSLRARLCHYFSHTSFTTLCESALGRFGAISEISYIPSVYSEAMYLIDPELRDEYAVLFDFGSISSTFSVVCSNGVAFSDSFSLGSGHIALYLTEVLGLPFNVAVEMLGKVNLNSRDNPTGIAEVVSDGLIYSYPAVEVKDRVREALDGICDAIEECAKRFTESYTDYMPLYITGESVKCIRGAAEYISGRLARVVNIASPHIPFYDKPQFGPLFSLIDAAISEKEKSSLLSRLFR